MNIIKLSLILSVACVISTGWAMQEPSKKQEPAKKGATGDKKAAAKTIAQEKTVTTNPALTDVKHADNLVQAPAAFKVLFETSAGNITLQVTRAWAPLGADRFQALVKNGYFSGCSFFRVVPGFVVQFGLNGDPKVTAVWREANITDDPVTQSNNRGRIVFATAGPNTRTTQLFINLANNPALDKMGFSPFGEVVEGMDVVDKIFKEYGEQPRQDLIQAQGAEYLSKSFPKLDLIKSAKILP